MEFAERLTRQQHQVGPDASAANSDRLGYHLPGGRHLDLARARLSAEFVIRLSEYVFDVVFAVLITFRSDFLHRIHGRAISIL